MRGKKLEENSNKRDGIAGPVPDPGLYLKLKEKILNNFL